MPPTRPGSTLSGLALPLLLITLPVAAPLHAHGGQGEQGHSHATEQTAAGKHDHTAEQSAAGTHDHAAGQSAAGTHDHAAGSAHEPAQLHKGTALIGARELYIENCGSCHGERGHGTEAAAVDFADAEALVRLTREAISAVLDDRHGGHLAAPVPAGERDEIIGYLRNYLMLPAPEADTDIGRCADILLPARGWSEKSGTVTNSERRISRQRAFLPPTGEAQYLGFQPFEDGKRQAAVPVSVLRQRIGEPGPRIVR